MYKVKKNNCNVLQSQGTLGTWVSKQRCLCETEEKKKKKKDNKMAKKRSTKVDAQQPSHVRFNSNESIIPSSTSPDVAPTGRQSTLSEIAAENDLPPSQRICHTPGQDPTLSIRCLPSELTEPEMIENLEWQMKQFEQDMIDEIECWGAQRDDIIALLQESDQWR